MSSGYLLFTDESGTWFRADRQFLERYAFDRLSSEDLEFLNRIGSAFEDVDDISYESFAFRMGRRLASLKPLSYLVLIPTLRCNLSCGYCQVSRAAETALGYDWTEEIFLTLIKFLDKLESSKVKIEFQGGEPLLRLDYLERVRDYCRNRFTESEFVVCTNLQNVGPAEWAFLSANDTYVSTSVDGPLHLHDAQRTKSIPLANQFFDNLGVAATILKKGHLSALPTIDVNSPPDIEQLIVTYESVGIASIFLRPINFQGFARRKGQHQSAGMKWNDFHSDFIDHLIERNFRTKRIVEDYYFSHCLKRVIRSGLDGHVDLRNPSYFGTDYIVVNYDGLLYPTDECRMLSRIGEVDLSIGTLRDGVDQSRIDALNMSSVNNYDPDCVHCSYQPFCGSDIVDDISRYGRIDVPRDMTWFCRRHLAIFDKIFSLIYDEDEAIQFSLAAWSGMKTWPRRLSRARQ